MSGIVEFGDELLRTRDLDPVYVAVGEAQLDRATLCRLSLAYWCFYNLGAAARLAEIKQPKKYWEKMAEAAAFSPLHPWPVDGKPVNGGLGWPRGSERRHFRGAQSRQAVAELASKYRTAEEAVESFCRPADTNLAPLWTTFSRVQAATKLHRGFGDWIAFKIADWSERVLGYDTDFSDCHLGIYKDPRQGAAVAYCEGTGPITVINLALKAWELTITDEALADTGDHYVKLWRRKKVYAPGGRKRLVNVQEVETIFCKYKSHLKGHYPMGKDTTENLHMLEQWGQQSDLAKHLHDELFTHSRLSP